MRNEPEHHREGMHIHGIHWHIGHWLHDPRFWVGVALAFVVALMIITLISAGTGAETSPRVMPTYPYVP